MSLLLLVVGVVLAIGILVGAVKLPGAGGGFKGAALVLAGIVLFAFVAFSSIRFIGANEVGVVVKNALGSRLKDGKIIAVNGEMGTQADVLSPGWHFWYWPLLYDVKIIALTEIKSDEVGLIETSDGVPLGEGSLFAPEWPRENYQNMLDARYFLTKGAGRKGKQVSVLTPGKYRINTELFRIKSVKQTEVLAGEVAVLKSNFGTSPSVIVHHVAAGAGDKPQTADDALKLAKSGEMGVVGEALPPGKYPLNTEAFTVTEVWTTQMIAQFTKAAGTLTMTSAAPETRGQTKSQHEPSLEEREITVRTNDGFTFPVDVRIEYAVEPKDAPIVVAKLGDDEGDRFRNAMNSAVRAIFRNNAEKVRALDYVQQRSLQESQSLVTLKEQLARFGITVTAVRIGAVGDEQTLGTLLKTQTDREIAKQEQTTFQEQQRAAEQQKLLTKTKQEADEEKRLATAAYSVKIADEEKRRLVIGATAEAESIKIKALAQAEAYKMIAAQIGSANAAMIELLKIVGEKNILITPRVMVTNHGGAPGATGSAPGQQGLLNTSGAETTALIGTMLDQMVNRDELPGAKPAQNGEPAAPPATPK